MNMFSDFESITKSMGELPPSPIVATKLLELLRQPDLKIKDLANAVSLDPVISARLMRMANSAFYQQMKQIKTVDRAIIVVGEDVLKNLAMEYSLRSTHKTYGVLERKLWENSVGCAVACRMLAERLTDLDKNEAYLAGLQHHIGKVVMINRDKDLYREVVRIVETGQGQLRDVERGLFAYSHEMVGRRYSITGTIQSRLSKRRYTIMSLSICAKNTVRYSSFVQLSVLPAISA